jgi:hypothetical protein
LNGRRPGVVIARAEMNLSGHGGMIDGRLAVHAQRRWKLGKSRTTPTI